MSEPHVAIVTGGGAGLGRAAALRLAADGRAIAIWDVEAGRAADTATQVEAAGGAALALEVDVRDGAAIDRAYREVVVELGPVHILVTAAGIIGHDASVLTAPLSEWHNVLDVNLTGVYLCCRTVVPEMAARGWGRIVTFTSPAAHGTPALVPYGVSKAGVTSLTHAFAREFTSQGVLINAIEPGRALTDMVLSRVDPKTVANPDVPIGRYADPAEIAEVVAFLCSERNTYMSGGVVPVRGGG